MFERRYWSQQTDKPLGSEVGGTNHPIGLSGESLGIFKVAVLDRVIPESDQGADLDFNRDALPARFDGRLNLAPDLLVAVELQMQPKQ